jgi:hypothetical protein
MAKGLILDHRGLLLILFVATSLTASKYAPRFLFKSSNVLIAVVAFALQLIAYFVYKVILYPHYFSPLRHLPGPDVSASWLN